MLTEAVHTVDGAGFLTDVHTRPPPLAGRRPGQARVTLGRVTDVDDPQRRGRVRVSLPAWGGVDAGWLGVVCPGAGQGRGIVALPDVGDTVLVALPHGDPAAGLVLGSLYGTVSRPTRRHRRRRGPPLVACAPRTASRSSSTTSAHSLRLADQGGSFVELAPDPVRVHANTDLVLEAPGHGDDPPRRHRRLRARDLRPGGTRCNG